MEINNRTQIIELLKHLNLPLKGVEVGVAENLHGRDLLEAGMEMYLVDNWGTLNQTGDGGSEQSWHDKNYAEAVERAKPYGDKATILRGLSSEMAENIPDGSLGLVYLDGNHSYDGVMSDLQIYLPKLVKNGVMAGHDYLNKNYGVFKAVEEFCMGKYEIHTIPEGSPENASFWFQVK